MTQMENGRCFEELLTAKVCYRLTKIFIEILLSSE
jgi:hypothetical protein